MTLRYCPECDKWYDTHEIELSDSGETICPKPDHSAVHASISPGVRLPISEAEFRRQNSWTRDISDELAAAKRQGLVK